jgi:hypothetical protein
MEGVSAKEVAVKNRSRASTGILLGYLLLNACGDEAVQRDAPEEGVVFDVVEELRIDGYEHELVPIDTTIRVAVSETGLIAIAQGQTNDVRFFSESGEPMGSLGRRGEGPAEFMQLWRLGWIADTLYAYDFSLRRFTLIDPDLQYVRYIHVPNGARPGPHLAGRLPEFSLVYGGALYADGSVYGQLAGALTPMETEHYDPTWTTYGRVAEDGTIISYFQWTSSTMDPVEVTVDGRRLLMSREILGSTIRPVLRLNDTGTRMAHLRVSMEGSDAGTFELEMEDVFSGTLYVRRYPFDVRPITEEMKDSIIDDMYADSPPEFAGVAEVVRREGVFPPMIPPVVGMVGGQDDSLWIRLTDTADGRPYLVLDPTGEPVGRITLPHNERIAVADLDEMRIWVIESDEYDVESVIRYRVVATDAMVAE